MLAYIERHYRELPDFAMEPAGHPKPVIYSWSLLMAVSVAIIAHNHNHVPLWKSRALNIRDGLLADVVLRVSGFRMDSHTQ